MRVHIDGHFSTSDLTPNTVDRYAVLAAKPLGTDVYLRRAGIGLVVRGEPVAQTNTAADRARLARRADRSRRLFNRYIDIRVTRPCNADHAVPNFSFLQFLQ